jgi:hypothetical protein
MGLDMMVIVTSYEQNAYTYICRWYMFNCALAIEDCDLEALIPTHAFYVHKFQVPFVIRENFAQAKCW